MFLIFNQSIVSVCFEKIECFVVISTLPNNYTFKHENMKYLNQINTWKIISMPTNYRGSRVLNYKISDHKHILVAGYHKI